MKGPLLHILSIIPLLRALSFPSNSTHFTCPTALSTPTILPNFSGGKLLFSPTSSEGQLCIISRVNRNATKNVYTPIARSYDGNDWHRVAGKYVSYVSTKCGLAEEDGDGFSAGENLCEIDVPMLNEGNIGYFVTQWEENNVTSRRIAARFLERATWGARWDEILELESQVDLHGKKALALWMKNQTSMQPSSHRAFFRQRLNPRTVESYQYGVPGPKACEMNARFRRFAFTYKDLELSRGYSGSLAGNNGLPFTTLDVETVNVGGVEHYAVKFGGKIRTVMSNRLRYEENGVNATVSDGSYTICHVEEFVGDKLGDFTFQNNVQFQLLVGDLCTSSYTNRGGVADGKGDGSSTEDIKVGQTLVRIHDKNACDAKCGDASKVKLILGGNPEVSIPEGFDKATLSWIDLSTLNSSEIININVERTHESSWLLQKSLETCVDQNGEELPDPARLAYTDFNSFGHGKYNLGASIFAKLPSDKWALHDLRTQFKGNTLDYPLKDGGGATVKAAARSGENDDGNPDTDLVVRCSNVQRNIINEKHCSVSYDENACVSVPHPVNGVSFMMNPTGGVDEVKKYLPPYSGPDGGGVVICGSENEVAPTPTEDDHFDVTNRKVQPAPIDFAGQKRTVWVEVVLNSPDQLCQRLAFGLSKIFATSTDLNSDSQNTETNIGVYDKYVMSCSSTYKDVMRRVSFDQEMSEQLTFANSKSVASDWHRIGKLAWPDENYARENLQLHSIGLLKLHEDGTPVLDRFKKNIANYEQKHIFTASKLWTGFKVSFRRGNYEDLDWATTSYLDPLVINNVLERDWFPKISIDGGYVGDKYPLCSDLPERHFLKEGATFRFLGGSSVPLSQNDPLDWEDDSEVYRMSLQPNSQLYSKLCDPTGAPPPSPTFTSGTGLAEYDATLFAPYCQGSNTSCDSGNLLAGRVTEVNSPNTIDGCSDGQDATSAYAESIKRIRVTSLDGDVLRGGKLVKIEAIAISNSKYDRVDFFYSPSASSADWVLITIVAPLVGETNITLPHNSFPDITYTLPKCLSILGCKQAVRVVLRSSRNPNNPAASSSRMDSFHKPTSNCATAPFDDADDLVFEVLPSPRPQDTCNFKALVTLDDSLECSGRECAVSTVRVVEVMPGVFYEYLRLPCVHFPFYQDAVKVFSGWSNNLAMCADKQLSSARSTCCGSYTDRDLSVDQWADVLSEYRGERLTYAKNEARCNDWNRTICDPQRIGPFKMHLGQCLHRQSCKDVFSSTALIDRSAYHWTTGSCQIQVKINLDGLIAIIHKPEVKWMTWNSQQSPQVQSHVNENRTVSYFYVHWDTDTSNVAAGKLEYPHVTDNACDGGISAGDFCLCETTVHISPVFDSVPTRDTVLAHLFVGAFDPTSMFDAGEYTVVIETEEDDGVSVYKKTGYSDYSEHTIFRAKDEHSDGFIFRKNVKSTVRVCDGTFFFRNSPTFFDITDPTLISGHHETDAYLDNVDRHDNTPPFVCKALSKHFGYSNPSPDHVLGCSKAYKSGEFTWTNPSDSSDTISFGTGARGDLQAISASILLSNDALSVALDSDPTFGGVKEPLHKLMQVMRSFEFKRSTSHRRLDGLITEYAQHAFGQAPYGIRDQFSFFSPDYSPPGNHIESDLVSPESELLNMRYIIGSQNALYALIQDGLNACNGGIGPVWRRGVLSSCQWPSGAVGYLNFTAGDDSLSQLATLLTADRLSAASKEIIEFAYAAALSSYGPKPALQVAQALMVSTPEFHTTNKAVPVNQERTYLPATTEDDAKPYKAIIHLNLFGGMDSMNLLVPYPSEDCQSLYDEYKMLRGDELYLPQEELIKIDASTSDQPCTSFGVNKHLGKGFVDMFDEGEVVFFANIGHLQKPVTAENFLTETTTQLFSHYTMRDESFAVDAFKEADGTGILGRMTDVLKGSSARSSIDSSSKNLNGDPTSGSKVDVLPSRGPQNFFRNDKFGIKGAIRSLNNITTDSSGIHADLWSQSFIDSQDQTENYISMLETVYVSTPNFISGDGLGNQLQMILKLIKLHLLRRVNRDTFAVSWGGFDTHFSLKSELNLKFDSLGILLRALRDELVKLDLWDRVTIVVSSEMGRTVTPNTSAGTDHGWGGHSIVMGGQLNGGKILGQHPHTYNSNWEYNTGRGAWIPTTSFEAMWLGIAQWFGVESSRDLSYVLPNMNNFGCRLYSETELYKEGTGKVPGCGGDAMQFTQVLFLSEPRLLTPDEQKRFCSKVVESITRISTRCLVLDQVIATRNVNVFERKLDDLGFVLDVMYEVSSDSSGVSNTVKSVLNSADFKAHVASVIEMGAVSVQSADLAAAPTSRPTTSSPPTPLDPTQRPSTHNAISDPSSAAPVQPSDAPVSVASTTNTPAVNLWMSLLAVIMPLARW